MALVARLLATLPNYVVAALSATMLASCGGKQHTTANNQAEPRQPSPQPASSPDTLHSEGPKQAVTAAVDPFAADLALLPIDSDMVLQADFAALRKSARFETLIATQLRNRLQSSSIARIATGCKIDLLATVRFASFARKGEGPQATGTAVLRGVSRSDFLNCFRKASAAEVEVGVDLIRIKRKAVLHFLDDTTLLVVADPEQVSRSLAQLRASIRALPDSAVFMELLSRTKPAMVRMLVSGNAPTMRQEASAALQSITLTADLFDTVSAHAIARFPSASVARIIADMFASAPTLIPGWTVSTRQSDADLEATFAATNSPDLSPVFASPLFDFAMF